jgi:hypothetical protein
MPLMLMRNITNLKSNFFKMISGTFIGVLKATSRRGRIFSPAMPHANFIVVFNSYKVIKIQSIYRLQSSTPHLLEVLGA